MNNYCLYHDNCPDGFAAAMVVWSKFGNKEWKYIGVKYQEPVPTEVLNDNSIDRILIVDFSYPKDVLKELEKHCQGLVVLDHHDTCDQSYSNLIFDREHSGCVITWKFLFPEFTDIPEMLLYVEDRDLWKWRMPKSREFNLGLEQVTRYKDNGEPNFERWYDILQNKSLFGELMRTGAMLLDYKRKLISEIASHAWIGDGVLGFNKVVCCENMAGSLTSELGEMLGNNERYKEAPFILIYGINNENIIVSLRASQKSQIHLGELCRIQGGGGHFQAAGFKRIINRKLLINLINE